MNTQNIIVFLIISGAALYVGSLVWKKVKSFSGKSSSCASDCGCDAKPTAKNSFPKIQKF